MSAMFEGRRILVTGGTGSWGYELVRQLLALNPEEVVVYSRSESAQVTMGRAFDDKRLRLRIGDVRDRESLFQACKGIDMLFHLAALKHVPICEEQPSEALKTNVAGTQNVVDAAAGNGVEYVVNVSTDKAANPSNFYGMTKAIAEKLIVYANLLAPQTRFFNVRAGNVLGSSGSVIHMFRDQMRNGQPLRLTDRNMTRFFMTVEETIVRLLQATEGGIGGETYILTMPSARIIDLAEVLLEATGAPPDIIETGVRPGEKLHELLLSEYESLSTVEIDPTTFVLLPPFEIPGLGEHYADYPALQPGSYSSAHPVLSKAEVRALLQQGGFIP